MAITVTAAQGGSTANGMLLRVEVLTQAAAAQNGATAVAGAMQGAITTTQAGSRVYGAGLAISQTSATPNGSTTQIDTVLDPGGGAQYTTFKAASATVTPGSVTIGDSAPAGLACALLEVMTAGTLTEDPSSPAAASSLNTATAVTTASFAPPSRSVLVALVSSNGGASVTTMTVSDSSGLPWTEKVKSNNSGQGYTGVWTAQVLIAAASSPAVAARDTSAAAVASGSGSTAAYKATYAAVYGAISASSAPTAAATATSAPAVSD